MRIRCEKRQGGATPGVMLLMVFAVGLCALCAFQWVREARQHEEIAERDQKIRQLHEAKNQAEGLAQRYEGEIERLEEDRGSLLERVQKVSREASQAKADLAKLQFESEAAIAQLDAYREALEKANASIQDQNEGIRTLNEAYKRLSEERNEVVEKYNDLARQYDELGGKYNEAVDRYNTLARRGSR